MTVRITGLGVICALGRGVDEVFQQACANTVGLRETKSLRGVSALVGEVFSELAPGTDRALTLARHATQQALEEAGWPRCDGVGLIVATTKGGIGLAQHVLEERAQPNVLERFPIFQLAAQLANEFGFSGPVNTVSVACASGTAALGQAARWLNAERCERVLVVGADALSEFVVHGFTTLRALCRDQARPFDRNRTGLSPGEGAGAVALESGTGDALAYLTGFGGSNDANHITGPSRDGAGLVRSIETALSDAGVGPETIAAISAHGTATRYNDGMEAVGFARVFGGANVPVHSLKGALGHTMGAAGVIEAVVAVRGLRAGSWPPTAGFQTPDPELEVDVVIDSPRPIGTGPVLSTSSGFSGINAAVVLDRSPVLQEQHNVAASIAAYATAPVTTAALRESAATLVNRPQRLDDICLAGLVATHRLLEKTGWTDLAEVPHAITLGTALGCLESDYAYYGQVLSRGLERTNPRLFAYTLPNVVLGEVAIAFGLTGDQLAVSAGRASGLAALAEAALRLESCEVERAIVLVIDAVGPGTSRLFEAAGRTPKPVAAAFALTRGEGIAQVASVNLGFQGSAELGTLDPDPLGGGGIDELIAALEDPTSQMISVHCPSGHRVTLQLK
ncbi:MAG: 3-oxoacyl-[acyl-carrier-protein] synthase II [Myxococcota bacterium]|jgi:3-oxoacyl-[acyl-carrier-protein] synthase II